MKVSAIFSTEQNRNSPLFVKLLPIEKGTGKLMELRLQEFWSDRPIKRFSADVDLTCKTQSQHQFSPLRNEWQMPYITLDLFVELDAPNDPVKTICTASGGEVQEPTQYRFLLAFPNSWKEFHRQKQAAQRRKQAEQERKRQEVARIAEQKRQKQAAEDARKRKQAASLATASCPYSKLQVVSCVAVLTLEEVQVLDAYMKHRKKEVTLSRDDYKQVKRARSAIRKKVRAYEKEQKAKKK